MKIGNLDISSFKVGSSDCTIYLGDVKVYPQKESYPYAFYRESRGGSGYTIECNATSAQTITSAQTRSGITAAQISGSSADQTPTKVVFGDCCKTINSGVCSGWTYLTSVTISDSVTTLQNPSNNRAFYECVRVEEFNIGSGITAINGIFAKVGTSATTKPNLDLSKNDGLTLSGGVFQSSSFNAVTLPNNLTIKAGPFGYCHMSSVTFNNNTTIEDASNISAGAFSAAEIGTINFNGLISIGDYAFANTYGYTSINVPSTVTKLGRQSLANSASTSTVTSITLDYASNATLSNYGILINTKTLKNVTIGNNPTQLSSCMFSGCTALSSVTIGSNVQTIGAAVFGGCTALTSITLPSSVTSISNTVFSGCSHLESVTILATTPPTLSNTDAFGYANSCTIYVPSEALSAYASESTWSVLYNAGRIQAIPT